MKSLSAVTNTIGKVMINMAAIMKLFLTFFVSFASSVAVADAAILA